MPSSGRPPPYAREGGQYSTRIALPKAAVDSARGPGRGVWLRKDWTPEDRSSGRQHVAVAIGGGVRDDMHERDAPHARALRGHMSRCRRWHAVRRRSCTGHDPLHDTGFGRT